MNNELLTTFAAWGDRSNRDTAHLLDIVIAGTIEQLQGHGTVRLLPSRMEEIVPRIAPRERDADGAWVVTLRPPAPEDDLLPVSPYDVLAYLHANPTSCMEDEDDNAFIASLVLAAAEPGVTMRDMGMQGFAMFVEWVQERRELTTNPVVE